ncbi:MAG: hypothetical protein FWG22_03700 [Prolixibacteraceae bacterium]|nr:hypothetical protein [Prolixibacteraceae bacterium]
MKKKAPIISVFCLFLMLAGFDVLPMSDYKPVFMQRSEMEKSVKMETARDIKNPGKIYIKGDTIFINEKYRGIHVIDNSNPETPDNIAFIQVDGCIDMAMKEDILYADNAVDLIALSINNNFTSVEVKSRAKNVFPELMAPNGRSLTGKEQQARPLNTVLVRWEKY